MEGKLTGIGVGPGDPELLTLKAVRAITESDILILPGRSRDGCYAYRIVQKACRRWQRRNSCWLTFR